MCNKMDSMVSIVVLVLGFCCFAVGIPGFRASSSNGMIRIVGGQNANIADYPYQASIMMDGQHACGASILTNTFLLTAAHCFVEESRVSHITIRVGSSFRTSGGQIFQVKRISSHPNFNADTYDYDVAVMELASTLTFGSGIQPIALASSSSSFDNGANSVTTGWGFTTNDGDLANQLQVVTVPLITTTTCQTRFYGSAVSSRMLCAGGVTGKDSCTGDSGGPLVYNGIQIGIVSWGDICGQASTPGVYTKITEFLTYINGIVGTRTKKS